MVLDTLAVDDARRRLRLPTFQFPRGHGQMKADRLPEPAVTPLVGVPLGGGGGWEIRRQNPPPATGRGHVQHRILDLSKIRGARTLKFFGR